MRVAHVVTQLSVDGAFGGPARVLREQVEELSARGYDMTVLAGWDGLARPTFPSDVTLLLCRARTVVPRNGFAGMVAPTLIAYLARHAREFDIVHVHLARDLITMPAALVAAHHTRLVVQPHGMIKPDQRAKARIMDAVVTRRVLRRSRPALFLTPIEERGLLAIASPLRLQHLANGIGAADPHFASDDGPVLFCARLHPRKRVLAFVEMAKILAQRRVVAQFRIAGPDGGDLKALETALADADGIDIQYLGAVAPERVQELLGSASVYVLPSVDEPFPMTVLESLASGTPVVLTDTCAIASDLAARGAALVTDGSSEALADAVQALLALPEMRKAQAAAGLDAVRQQYSISAVVDQLEAVYGRVIA